MSLGLASVKRRMQVFSALQYRDFRLYWSGQVVSVSGLQMVILTEGWLVWKLTGSEVLLGMVGLAEAAPAVVLSLFGGAVADKVDLRRLLVALQVVYAVALVLLASLTAIEMVQVWHIFVLAVVFGTVEAFDNPGRQAFFPHLLDRRNLMSAVSLNATIWPGTRIFGPAIAGVVIDRVAMVANAPLMGAAVVFYLASLGFALYGLFLFLIKVPPVERTRSKSLLTDIGEGLKFIWSQRLFSLLIGMTFLNSFFVGSHTALLPVFTSNIFEGNGTTLGSLFAAGGVGSLSGALAAASLANFRRRGWLIIGGASIQALILMLFASTSSYTVALVLLPLAGIGFSLFMVSSQSTVQFLVPDEFRGRVMAVWGLTYSAVMPLGRAQMGAVAGFSRTNLGDVLGRFAGAPTAVILGASVMLAATLFGAGPNPRIRDLSVQELTSVPRAPDAPQEG